MRSKLPELKRETENPFKEEIRESDWSNKLKGKLYADEKRGAVSKSINVEDEVLLRAEKSNKLSLISVSALSKLYERREVRSRSHS